MLIHKVLRKEKFNELAMKYFQYKISVYSNKYYYITTKDVKILFKKFNFYATMNIFLLKVYLNI